MGVAALPADPLAGGFYSPQVAARLLRMNNAHRITGWLAGYRGGAGPMVLRDYEPAGGKQALSFLDLMEIRFLDHFRRQGMSLQTLRKAAVRAREEIGSRHPFALSNLKFLTDRRQIFGQAAQEAGDAKTWNLVTNQYEMYEAIEHSVAKGVAFDPRSGLARNWHPSQSEYPDVVIDPRHAFGRPVVGAKHVPTGTILRMWRAESGNRDRVAKAFGALRSEIDQAIEFELTLAAA
jgi:uncharacterized protein (DUF433 family)